MSVLWWEAEVREGVRLPELGLWTLDGLPLLEVWEVGDLQSVSEEITVMVTMEVGVG